MVRETGSKKTPAIFYSLFSYYYYYNKELYIIDRCSDSQNP